MRNEARRAVEQGQGEREREGGVEKEGKRERRRCRVGAPVCVGTLSVSIFRLFFLVVVAWLGQSDTSITFGCAGCAFCLSRSEQVRMHVGVSVSVWKKMFGKVNLAVAATMLLASYAAGTKQWKKSGGSARDAGILYEIWHTGAAHLMHRNAAMGLPQLTVETVIRSDGNLTLDDVFSGGIAPGFNPDIYNTEPALGASMSCYSVLQLGTFNTIKHSICRLACD